MRSKLLIVFCILFVYTRISTAQNLVNNPGFEIYTACPTGSGQVHFATGWSTSGSNNSFTASTDYLNSCSSGTFSSVPTSGFGYQDPANGEAYAGMLCYGSFASSFFPEAREFCTGTLVQPLPTGVKYFVSFKAVRMDLSNWAINNLGAIFMTSASPNQPITNAPHIFTTTIISDSVNWTMVTGSFIADSNYTHISIGNHFNDSSTSSLSIQPISLGNNAYYFVDDVCVSVDSLTCNLVSALPEHESDFATLYPNPFYDSFKVQLKNYQPASMIITDISGRIIDSKELYDNAPVSTTGFSSGMYICIVRTTEGLEWKKKIIKF